MFPSTTKDLRSKVGESCQRGRNLSHLGEPCMICLLAGVVPANRPHYYQAELNIGWLFLTASSFGNVKLVVIEQCLPASSKSPT